MHSTSAFFSTSQAVIGAEIGLQLHKGGIYYTFYALIAIAVSCAFGLLTISVPLKIAERVDFSHFASFIGVVCACNVCPIRRSSRPHN